MAKKTLSTAWRNAKKQCMIFLLMPEQIAEERTNGKENEKKRKLGTVLFSGTEYRKWVGGDCDGFAV